MTREGSMSKNKTCLTPHSEKFYWNLYKIFDFPLLYSIFWCYNTGNGNVVKGRGDYLGESSENR